MERRDRLLRRSDQVLVISVARDLLFRQYCSSIHLPRTGIHMIKCLIKFVQLSSLGHGWLLHEKGRLDKGEISLLQPVHAIVDERLVEPHARSGKVVSSVTC